MSTVLVDTSVWIEYFNGSNRHAAAVSDLLDHDALCINELILAELLPAILHAGETNLARLLHEIPTMPLAIDWERIVQYQSYNLKKGISKAGIPDLIIMQNALDHNLQLFTFDRHFELMAGHHKLKLFRGVG